jgi:hypothetical protein
VSTRATPATPDAWTGQIDNHRSGDDYCISFQPSGLGGDVALERCNTAGQSNLDTDWTVYNQVDLSLGVYYEYQNLATDDCLGGQDGTSVLTLTTCDSSGTNHNMYWHSSYLTSSYYELVNGHSGQHMGTRGGGTAAGTLVTEGPEASDPWLSTQIWASRGQ